MKLLRTLTLASVVSIAALTGPSQAFDCSKATETDEFAICDSCDLRVLDEKMATLYGVLNNLVGMGQRGQIKDDQRDWLKYRGSCGSDSRCLRDAYLERIAALERGLQRIYHGGPY